MPCMFSMRVCARFSCVPVCLCARIGNSNMTEWSPIRAVIITSDKQNWISAEREFNLFSRVMITYRIGQHEVL